MDNEKLEYDCTKDKAYKGLSSRVNLRKVNKRVLKQYYKDIKILSDLLNIEEIKYKPKLHKTEIIYVQNYEIKIRWKPNKDSTWLRPIFINYRKI